MNLPRPFEAIKQHEIAEPVSVRENRFVATAVDEAGRSPSASMPKNLYSQPSVRSADAQPAGFSYQPGGEGQTATAAEPITYVNPRVRSSRIWVGRRRGRPYAVRRRDAASHGKGQPSTVAKSKTYALPRANPETRGMAIVPNGSCSNCASRGPAGRC
jgi:hypothetical protein